MKKLAMKRVGACVAGMITAVLAACSAHKVNYEQSEGYARVAAPSETRYGTAPYDSYVASDVLRYSSDLVGGNDGCAVDVPRTADFQQLGAPAAARTHIPQGAFSVRATDELWVIARCDDDTVPIVQTNDDYPGCGSLITQFRRQEQFVPVPLKHTGVSADINGYIVSVNVKQQFHNPYNSNIEAVYVFPLPENAAVNDFVMTIGARSIRGIIREREQAERIYNQAKSQGYTASLMTQERPNIFTQRVANIEPGRSIDIDITYFNTLAYSDGWFSFVFPMVVGPRFNPPGSTDPVAALPREVAGNPQTTSVNYLRPAERNGHDISINVDIDAGVEIEELASNTHHIDVQRPAGYSRDRATVSLKAFDTIPNRDFVLRYRVASDEIKSGIITHRDDRGSFFSMLIVPPRKLENLQRSPLELVFVIDCSGSMNGRPIDQAREAIRSGLSWLREDDTFQIIEFSNTAGALGSYPVAATHQNRQRAEQYLNSLQSSGGTMMINGIRAALEPPCDPSRPRYVVFLTDGFIGNESEILSALQARLGPSRIFGFGVGASPNRFLMDRMSKLGRGAVAYLNVNDNPREVMQLFFDRIAHPALTDILIDWAGANVSEVFPSGGRGDAYAYPDLFVGRPVLLTGRLNGTWQGAVRVNGRAGGREMRINVPTRSDNSRQIAALPAIWARQKISELSDRVYWQPGHDPTFEIRDTALSYNLLSSFTSFVAVDSLTRTTSPHGTTVNVPVPVPHGVRYDTTVGNER